MRPLASLVGLTLLPLACMRAAAHAPVDSKEPEFLLVLPGAENVDRRSQGGAAGVLYELPAQFPAAAQIDQIVNHMTANDWKPLSEDWLNPGVPTSLQRGWTSFIDATHALPLRRYSWSGEWENSRGDLVEYSLAYEASRKSGAFLERAKVRAQVIPESIRRQAQEQTHVLQRRNERTLQPPPTRSEDLSRTVEDAQLRDCFLLSNHRGDAIIQILETAGSQVAYRWRFRASVGEPETSGNSPPSSTIHAGPFELAWMPSGFTSSDAAGAVGFYDTELDMIPLPSGSFERLDLGAVHRLAASLTERNRRFAEFRAPTGQVMHDRIGTFLESGKTVSIHLGQAALLEGVRGGAVLELEMTNSSKLKYRWRFRPVSSKTESEGAGEVTDTPLELIRVGPYEVECDKESIKTRSDARGSVVIDWSARVIFLPEEVSVTSIPLSSAAALDLTAVSATPPATGTRKPQ